MIDLITWGLLRVVSEGGVLAVPVPKEEREAVFEETRKAIELMKQCKWVQLDDKHSASKS